MEIMCQHQKTILYEGHVDIVLNLCIHRWYIYISNTWVWVLNHATSYSYNVKYLKSEIKWSSEVFHLSDKPSTAVAICFPTCCWRWAIWIKYSHMGLPDKSRHFITFMQKKKILKIKHLHKTVQLTDLQHCPHLA